MKIIILAVNGGFVSPVKIPKNVKIIVRDYDCEGVDIDFLKCDEDGDDYREIIFEEEKNQ